MTWISKQPHRPPQQACRNTYSNHKAFFFFSEKAISLQVQHALIYFKLIIRIESLLLFPENDSEQRRIDSEDRQENEEQEMTENIKEGETVPFLHPDERMKSESSKHVQEVLLDVSLTEFL